MDRKIYFKPEEVDERYRSDIQFIPPVLLTSLTNRYRTGKVKDRFERQDFKFLQRLCSDMGDKKADAESRSVAACWPRIQNMINWDQAHVEIKPRPTPIQSVFGFIRTSCAFAKSSIFASSDPRFNYVRQRINKACKETDVLKIHESSADGARYVELLDNSSAEKENHLIAWLESPIMLRDTLAKQFGTDTTISSDKIKYVLQHTGGKLRFSRLCVLLASTFQRLEYIEQGETGVEEVAISKDAEDEEQIASRLAHQALYIEFRPVYFELDPLERRLAFLSERLESDLTVFEASLASKVETFDSLSNLLEVPVDTVLRWNSELSTFRKSSNLKVSKQFVAQLTGVEESRIEGKLKAVREKLERKMRVQRTKEGGIGYEA
jgi:hypothetical protein